MKLEHLVQAYKVNNIEVELKDMSEENEKAGVITFSKGISASYLLDDEDIITVVKMFFICLTVDALRGQNQINHIIKVLNVMQNTMMLLCNIPHYFPLFNIANALYAATLPFKANKPPAKTSALFLI